MTRDNYIHLLDIYWPIGVGVGLLVWIVSLGVLWRNRAARVGDKWPTGKDQNLPLEVGYAFLLVCVVAMLVYFTFSTMDDYGRAAAAPGGERVDVVGAQWNWRFSYPKYGIVSEGLDAGKVHPTLTVPVDTPIRFRGTSDDVIHSFLIPHERFQRQVFPGRTTTWVMSFEREALGHHVDWGECTQFCGIYHSYMKFDVDVLSKEDFRRWVDRHRSTGGSG
jgi:cytochrome c oxidase subunit 2